MTNKELLTKAKEILKNNWKGSYTVPSSHLYPHQWGWDSAFIAIGYSNYDTDKAQKELLSIFEGQWKNGMVPHIIFRAKESYFPGPDYWDIKISKNSPNIKTSGITQPPVYAIAALEIYKKDNTQVEFLKEIYPKLLAFSEYLLTKRDPEKSGLVTIFHPWESGFDNSLRWDSALARIKPENLPKYKRVDNELIDSAQRPDNETYDKYVYLIEIMKKYKYDEEQIYDEIPFKIKDIVFSSILYKANQALLEIAKILKKDTKQIEEWICRTKKSYSKYCCTHKNSLTYDYDLVTKKRVHKKTIAALVPLFTDLLNNDQAKELVEFMQHSHFCKENCEHNHPVASSMSMNDPEFNPLNYWRGPIWINVNWLLYQGLKEYEFNKEAKSLKDAIIHLIDEHGFFEYYNPLSGKGLGTDNFSWTAALLIDIISEK